MKLIIKLASLALLTLSGNAFGMITHPKTVYVKNNLNRRLKVSWTNQTNELLSKIIGADQEEEISKFNRLAPLSSVSFEAYGDYVGYTAWPTQTTVTVLDTEFQQLTDSNEESLQVTVSQGLSPYLSTAYKIYTPPIAVIAPGSVIQAFPGLIYYPALRNLTADDILAFDSWRTIVIPQPSLHNQTTAEDVFRYILNVPKDYTERQIKEAHKALTLRWHPDKNPTNKELAAQVFTVIQKAHEELQKALEEK